MLSKKLLQEIVQDIKKCNETTAKDVAHTALTYREMLEMLEWIDDEYGEECCPMCGEYKFHGHAEDCELATMLRGGK